MSVISVELFKKLETVEPSLRSVLLAILEEIEKQQEERVTKYEFRELKGIVADLAKAQRRKNSKQEIVSLLSKLIKDIDIFLKEISDSMGYSFENRIYKALPGILYERYSY